MTVRIISGPLCLPTNIADFWRRWHITLSGWARDYVFFPLLLRYRNPYLANVATMLTIGLWHAFNINWILWSLSHAGAMITYDLYKKSGTAKKLSKNATLRWPARHRQQSPDHRLRRLHLQPGGSSRRLCIRKRVHDQRPLRLAVLAPSSIPPAKNAALQKTDGNADQNAKDRKNDDACE